jgi:hypothetical protein
VQASTVLAEGVLETGPRLGAVLQDGTREGRASGTCHDGQKNKMELELEGGCSERWLEWKLGVVCGVGVFMCEMFVDFICVPVPNPYMDVV